MRIIRPNDLAGPKGMRSPARPDWFAEWLANQGKWVLLDCECIEDVKIPQCITLLTGKKITILCPFGHGFQRIKKTLKFREVLEARGIEFPEPPGQLPPF